MNSGMSTETNKDYFYQKSRISYVYVNSTPQTNRKIYQLFIKDDIFYF